MADTAPVSVSAPRVVYVAPSLLVPGAQSNQGAPQAAATAPTGSTAPTTQQQAQAPAAGAPAPAQAKQGVSMLQRVLGVMPIATGLAQALLGFFITNGRVSLAAVPLLGKLPPFIAGSLIAATAMPTLIQGLGKILGKQ